MGIAKRSNLADKDIPAEIVDLYRTVAILELDILALRLDAIQFSNPEAKLDRERRQLDNKIRQRYARVGLSYRSKQPTR
jgi:hypothetical protein